MTDYQIGQTFWVVPGDGRRNPPYEANIAKIGRLWITLVAPGHELRMDKDTGEAERATIGYTPTIYPSKAAWETRLELRRAWQVLADEFRLLQGPRKGVTLDDIRQATRLLGVAQRDTAAGRGEDR